MARYGGGAEEFNAASGALDKFKARLTDIERKEAAALEATEELGAATDRASTSRQRLNRAKAQGREISEREQAVTGQEAAAIDVNTAAIERNRLARERRSAAAKRESIDISRALRGAQDPLLGPAGAISQGGGGIRQYRQQLGVGYSRARALEDALSANFRPQQAPLAVGAPTRALAAREGVVRAEVQYESARKAYTNAVRRGAEEEAVELDARRTLARQSLEAAKAEEQAALAQAEARREATVATREAAAREAERAVGGPGVGAGTELTRRYGFPGVPGRTFLGGQNVPTLDPVGYTRLPSEDKAAAAGAGRQARLQQIAQEQAALGNATNAQAAYNASLSTEQRAFVEANRAQANLATGQIAERSRSNALAFEREGAALGSVSQSMYKHGALTQEFILAAARGETTLRELGNQALVTAGKFGGWTIAATAVFGVARALGEVVTGAKDAQSGTANLQRFVPNLDQGRAYKGYVQQSQELNVPISDVTTAQAAFARVFRDQDQALTAARVSILAYKLDNISAADSQRFFTGIVQEWGLAADSLPGKFDQISRAQRVMGARVAETLPSIARSSAAVKNAGGDLNQLIALATTAQVASGQTGNVVGTAFTRAASNFSRNPNNREIIRSLGINPDQGFTQMLIEAVRKSSHLTGDQRTELAKAIGGPQYGGRIFQTLLGQQDRLNNALKETSPAKSQGSAMEELHDKLKGVDEELKAMGIALQDVGANLARAGAFDLAGLLLHGLTDALHIAVQLSSAFNSLPGPLRHSAAILAEVVLSMRAIRRFAPESLAGSAGGRLLLGGQGGADQLTRTRLLRGLRDTQGLSRDEAESTQRRASTIQAASSRADLAAQAAVVERDTARAAAAAEGTAVANVRLEAAELKVNQANARAAALAQKAALAAEEAALAAEIMAAADARYAEAKALSAAELKGSSVLPAYAPRNTHAPNAEGVQRIERDASVLSQEEQVVATQLTARDRAVQAVSSKTSQLAQRFPRTAGRLRNFARGLESLGPSLGVMNTGFIALIAGEALVSHVLDQQKQGVDLQNRLNARRDTADKLSAGRQLDRQTAKDDGPFSDAGRQALENVIADDRVKAMQAHQRKIGGPVYLQTYDQLIKSIQSDQRKRVDGILSQAEFDKSMAKHAEESKHLVLDTSAGELNAVRVALAGARRAAGGGGYGASLKLLDDKSLQAEGQAVGSTFSDRGGRANLRHLRAVYEENVRRFGKSSSPAEISQLSSARQAYFQALSQDAQATLALQQSQTADPLRKAHLAVEQANGEVQRARRVYGTRSAAYRQALAGLNAAQQAVGQALLANVQADNNLLLARAGSDPTAQANAGIQAARNTLNALLGQRRRHPGQVSPNDIKNARADLIRAQTQRADQIRSDAKDLGDLEGQLAVARAGGDPIAAARVGIANARRAIGAARNRKERLQAQIDLVNAQNELSDAIAAMASARFDFLESKTTDPVAIARLELRKAQANLKGKHGADRYSALADVNRARQGLRDASLQGKEDDIDFDQEMGKIDVQTAIDRYQALLHTRNLTKQQKRDIQRKIHSLSQEADSEASGFDLDVGSLKLPTIYDIRRALGPVRDQVNAARRKGQSVAMGHITDSTYVGGDALRGVHNDINANVSHLHNARADVQATVNVYVRDKGAAGEVYTQIDRALGTHVRARMRSKRMR